MNELKELLSKYFSEHKAEQLSNIITQDVPILIDGIQGPTGKTTLCSKLKALGYDAQELWETKKDERHDNSFKIIISLNETIT